jgi:hypothetical protein
VSAPSIIRLEGGNARILTLSAVLAVLAPKARVRKPEVAHWGVGARDERFTPPNIFAKVVHVLGPIDLDPCGHPESPVRANKIYYPEDDGLAQPWEARTIYINPPFSAAREFVQKAYEVWNQGTCEVAVALLQVQMHHHWVHDYLIGQADIFFLRGKIAFQRIGKPSNPAPFGSMIVFFGADWPMIERMLATFDCVHLPRSAAVGRANDT